MLAVKNNTIQLTGFYSSVRENGKANKELKGIFNATINLSTNTNTNLKFNEFDHATKVKLLGERRANKGKDLKPLYQILIYTYHTKVQISFLLCKQSNSI